MTSRRFCGLSLGWFCVRLIAKLFLLSIIAIDQISLDVLCGEIREKKINKANLNYNQDLYSVLFFV
jgi:hypothetical protein